MKRITVQKMRIENFKGIKSLELDFDGKNALISGYNATGKSTIMDAFSWLLWGKNAAGATRFEVRPRDKNMCEIHDIITSVEATLIVTNNGETVSFKMRRDETEDTTKEERAKLKPTDIANKKSFYFIDNAPYQSKQFSQKVAELLAPEDIFMLASNPMAFFQLKEDKQRELLFGSCGLVPHESVEGWQEVRGICGAVNTPEQTRDALEKQITACKRKAEEIPARIDSLCKLYDMQADYESLIAEQETQKGEYAFERKKLSDEKETLVRSLGAKKEPPKPSDKAIKDLEYELLRTKSDVEIYRGRINDALFYKAKNTCPKCGYILEDSPIDIEQSQKDMELAQIKVVELTEKLAQAQTDYAKSMQEYKNELARTQDNSQTLAQIQELENRISEISKEYNDCGVKIAQFQAAQKAATEGKNLRQELREIDDVMADVLSKLNIVKEWIYRKNQLQMESINKHFEKVMFTLYEMQANGNYKPCCKATIDGISYQGLNTAKKIYAGIELNKLFAKSYDISAPLWVDNRESIFEIPPIDSQIIFLKADETKPTLTVETEI